MLTSIENIMKSFKDHLLHHFHGRILAKFDRLTIYVSPIQLSKSHLDT